MKKLKFRLERVRKFKEQIEEERKRSLVICQNRLLAEKNKLVAVVSTRNRYVAGFGVRKTGRVNLTDLVNSKRFIDKLAADIVVQTKIMKTAENNMTAAQKALLGATREKKKYEKLKERQQQKHNKENAVFAIKQLDEFGSNRALGNPLANITS